jgi:hypothetical protein
MYYKKTLQYYLYFTRDYERKHSKDECLAALLVLLDVTNS